MKRKILIVLLLALGFMPSQGNAPGKIKKKKIIVLDAGHGGKDTGALGKKAKEKDIVLSIAIKVGQYIEKNLPDVQVIYTRKTDVFIPLDERAEIANKNNADLFISIHANSNKSNKPVGTETYTMGLHKTQGNLEVAQKENSVIVLEDNYQSKYEGFDPNVAESYIIFSMMQNIFLEQSLNLAANVQNEFKEKALRQDRGVKQAGFLVLWHTTMPSVLVEVGFVSHPEEEKYLLSEPGQDHISSAIYRAIKQYLAELEKQEAELDSGLETLSYSTEKSQAKDSLNLQGDESITFRLQITSSTKKVMPNHPIFKGFNDVFEFYENNTYKYAIGKSTNYDEVKKLQQSVKNDFPGAFIIAFKNNQKVDLKQVLTP
ncbi:MAG TPA: N-acetylmuramoyl-L-alanine amidase [Marinilabiliales bacterium]|jgi:N-acetylmuramoyl-L-alanine amidase|nr:MAG: hypothetical protein A2W95_10145 [Bacteroidetes bacterium GWA2_40_14]OFX60905.1 MAG: hypothetical protein A2W84_17710 [Bacteroidetes bacterium GWC2_40_13]OFX71560.1 MAG: hypothetical protein A2W96_10460 [Bacteroidetes bacterium GWD2_40_43]OFX95594.1 MAG: hypothetical protein A2W97_00780 [Bacteroidetes bacterium GWE2_40_63]OFY22248.1 MAG: hypothetical protein A2W88_06945 [Bacteroidetes bacterium GWF2_40_13]OFZ24885.1 MAG: hypothetical protein A2437_14580 [Bacteroidetes bacterium RIFOXYC